MGNLENYALQMKSSINDENLASRLSEDAKQNIVSAIANVTTWLDKNQSAEKEEFERKQKELEGICLPLLQAAMSGSADANAKDDTSAKADFSSSYADGPTIEEID